MSAAPAILQILPALEGGGVERGTLEITAALVKEGFRALVASSGGRWVSQLEALGAQHITLPLQSKNPWQMWRNAAALTTIATQHQVKLLHVRSRAPAWSALCASRRLQIPLVTTFHGQYGHASALKRFYNSAMLRGDACIAVSDFIAAHILTAYPPTKRLVTIYRGIDTAYFDPQSIAEERRQALREVWQCAPTQPIVLLPGRLTRLKGHLLLIEALSHLQDLNFDLIIVGDTTQRAHYVEQCQNLAKEKGVRQTIRFVGNCDDMPAAYALSDIVVSASMKPEAFGRTLCEAQAMGCRAVAANHGGAQETLKATQPAGLYAPNDAAALAAAIRHQFSLTPQERHALAERSRAHVATLYSLRGMQSETLDVYRELLNDTAPTLGSARRSR